MQSNYYKTNGDITVSISGNYLNICDKEYDSIYSEDESKFLCKCFVDIFSKDRVFIYDVRHISNITGRDIADIIRKKIKFELCNMAIPTDGNMEFEIFGELIKVTYRWVE